jgi:glycine cleavage system H protein
MNTPAELLYSRTHEWVKEEADGTLTVGITDYAQDKLGSLVFINLPAEGDEVTEDQAFCDVESVKADSDIISPVSGTIREVNLDLESEPEKLNSDPYGAWIAKITPSAKPSALITAEEYQKFCEEEDG